MNFYGQRISKFPRRSYYAANSMDNIQVDLVDLHSKEAGYILNGIDVFSRKLESIKLSNKNKESLKNGLKELFNKFGSKPKTIQSDKESAIYSRDIQDWLKSEGIELYTVGNAYDGGYSAPIVERVNRTMRDFMMKLKQQRKSRNYVQLSKETVDTFPNYYNNKVHRTLGVTPNQVFNKEVNNSHILHEENQRVLEKKKEPKQKFSVGNLVYVAKPKRIIENKYEIKWLSTPYFIKEVVPTNPTTYKLEGKIGSYYKQQLKRVVLKKTGEEDTTDEEVD